MTSQTSVSSQTSRHSRQQDFYGRDDVRLVTPPCHNLVTRMPSDSRNAELKHWFWLWASWAASRRRHGCAVATNSLAFLRAVRFDTKFICEYKAHDTDEISIVAKEAPQRIFLRNWWLPPTKAWQAITKTEKGRFFSWKRQGGQPREAAAAAKQTTSWAFHCNDTLPSSV